MALGEDDVARTIRELGRPGAFDVCLVPSKREPGKLTWCWDARGDLVWDDSGSYPVLISVLAHRNKYRFARTMGTYLYAVRRERSTTGSQLAGYARDGAAQAEVAGVATDISTRAERQGPGSWRLFIKWRAAGKQQGQELRF